MIKGIVLGIILGIMGVAAGAYFYFATGRAPVAVTAPEMPFERRFARLGLIAYLNKLPSRPTSARQRSELACRSQALQQELRSLSWCAGCAEDRHCRRYGPEATPTF